MIREERSPDFWFDIASHPALEGALMGLSPVQVVEIAGRPSILPLASDNGGFFFGQMDGVGFVQELHTLYRPAGWGREVAGAAKEAFEFVFRTAQIVVTFEVEANHRSRPPRSFGFVRAGEWQASVIGNLRLWALTKLAWDASPARRRLICRR